MASVSKKPIKTVKSPVRKKASSSARTKSPAKKSLAKGINHLHITALTAVFIAIFSGIVIFIANPGTSEAASASGQITGIGNKCLDNRGGVLKNNNPITLWSCNGTAAQKWTLPGDGTVRLGVYCLDIPNASTKVKTKVQLYKCNGTKAQVWSFKSNGSIVNPNSNLCLDDSYGSTANGNAIWIYTCNGTAAQKWTIPKAPVSSSDSTMPVGDLPGWKQIFTEDFKTSVSEGSFAAANGNVLPAAYKDKFWTYPNGWDDTLKHGKYMPSQTMSVQDGIFQVRMRNEGGVNKVGALLPKLVNKQNTNGDKMGQLYGRYSIRFKADATQGYKIAWLLWPDSTGGIQHSPAGEIDFPEGELDGNILGFVHPTEQHGYNGGQFSYDTKAKFSSGWHVATTEWSPGKVKFIFDGKTVGQTTTHIPDTKMSWVIQSETAMIGPLPAKNSQASAYIDWVAAWSYKP